MSAETRDADKQRAVLQAEFDRAARSFSERTKRRFDHMDVVSFSRVRPGARVLEVGAGTGNFLELFQARAERLIAVDLTFGMLTQGRSEHPHHLQVMADGAKLPFDSRSFDLVACAQVLHHVWEPVPLLKEMRRVVRPEGRVLIVDQLAPESYEKTAFMNQMEALRDPSHATSRAPSTMRVIVGAAGLEIVDEKIVGKDNRLSDWMWPSEYPAERIEAVRDFIGKFGAETGMEWRKEGDDWVYSRERMMILAKR